MRILEHLLQKNMDMMASGAHEKAEDMEISEASFSERIALLRDEPELYLKRYPRADFDFRSGWDEEELSRIFQNQEQSWFAKFCRKIAASFRN